MTAYTCSVSRIRVRNDIDMCGCTASEYVYAIHNGTRRIETVMATVYMTFNATWHNGVRV